jgi:hypothetical protein
MRHILYALGIALAVAGCMPGHTYSPLEANQPFPVAFYAAHVVSVQNALIGNRGAGIGLSAGPAPIGLIGLHAGPGLEPVSGHVGVAAIGVGIGPGIEAPASALEYTVALDPCTAALGHCSPASQIVQISQQILPEDMTPATPTGVISPGQPALVRVVDHIARVVPYSSAAFSGIPPSNFNGNIISPPPLGLPVGSASREPVYASPPHRPGLAAASSYPIYFAP